MAADRAFLAALADQAAQALERARLYEERAYVARTLQAGLLPERLTEIPGLEVAVRYHSIADGGDRRRRLLRLLRHLARALAGGGRRRGRQGHRGGRAHRPRAPHAARDRAARRAARGHAAVPQRGAAAAVERVGVLHGRLRAARPRGRRRVRRAAWPSAATPTRCSCGRAGGSRRWSCAARCSASRPSRSLEQVSLSLRRRRHARALHRRRGRRARRGGRPLRRGPRCARRSTRPPVGRPRRWRRRSTRRSRRFEPERTRDDRAILVLRVS